MKEPNWIADNQVYITAWYIWKVLQDISMANGIGEYSIPWRMRWFYKVKAIICLIFNWEPDYKADPYQHLDAVTVAIPQSGSGFNGEYMQYWAEYFNVGPGVFRNWWYCIFQDSN